MDHTTASNASGVGAPGRRPASGMCGMYAIRCLIAVTVNDGRVAWWAEFNR